MPSRCKDIYEESMNGTAVLSDEMTEEERKFLFDEFGEKIVRTYEDFKIGLKVPDKLRPVRIKGGIVLKDTYYTMR